MTVETKFEVGYVVWFMKDNHAVCGCIRSWTISSPYLIGDPDIEYFMEEGGVYAEEELFSTKTQLLESL